MFIDPTAVALLIALLLLGLWLRAPFTAALFMALPFGATAVMMMGGASISLYTPLAILFIASAFLRPHVWADLRKVFAEHREAAVVAFLLVYVVAGAFILPRLFAGQTTVFVPGFGRIMEAPLGPVPGNINQTCYFIVDALAFFAASLLLLRPGYFRAIKVALFAFATVHAGLCLIDLGGKLAGAGDVLIGLRSAGYMMLTEVRAEGFWRIVGGYTEASSCAAATATAFAFTFSYWRTCGSRPAFALMLTLGALLLLSTSSTGYVVLAALAAVYFAGLAHQAIVGRLDSRNLWIIACGGAGIIALLIVALVNEHAMEPLAQLLQGATFDKAASASAAERFYWNAKSIDAFMATGGLGVGIGSSRASSWLIAVLSQVGVVGAMLFAVLVWQVLRPLHRGTPAAELMEVVATGMGIRAAQFATIVAMLTSAGSVDPGIPFFIALAYQLAARKLLSRSPASARSAAPRSPTWDAAPATA